MSIKLDGKATADKLCANLKLECDCILAGGISPTLDIITIGEDDASEVYIRQKEKRCKELGIKVVRQEFNTTDTSDGLPARFWQYVTNIHSPYIMQMAKNTDENIIVGLRQVSLDGDPGIDADGFVHWKNVSDLMSGKQPVNAPCTPAGIMYLLDQYGFSVDKKNVCIIGRSNIVGRPLAHMMEMAGATVTLCHTHTQHGALVNAIQNADIVVSATGKKDIFTLEMAQTYKVELDNKILIDVGMVRDENGKLRGDFDPKLFERCKAYTPVPGGVGPMTVAMLMKNVVNHYTRMLGEG